MEDSKIIEMFNQRSEEAIESLDGKYGALCRSIARNILESDADASECVNDAYLGAWNSIPPHRPDVLSAYICRIVRNISIARYHKNTARKRNSRYDEAFSELCDCLSSRENTESEVSAKELTAAIDSFLDGIDTDSRVIFMRRYWFSDSVRDIARRMKMSENSVSVRLLRTRERLRDHLRKEGFEI